MNRTRFLPFAIFVSALLLPAIPAWAQFELTSGSFNTTYVPQDAGGAVGTPSGPPVVFDPPASPMQFAAVAEMSGAAGPMNLSAALADRHPATADKSLVLVRASIGVIFSTGVTRYTMGEEILPPFVKADGSTPADANYWRRRPVLPGETIPGHGVPLPGATVNVTSASTSSTAVILDLQGPPPNPLQVGSEMLGQPITKIVGSTVTLAGNASTNISASSPVVVTPATQYYYSPHSEKVYASQPGGVSITWVSRQPNGSGNYELLTEEFAVSSTTLLTVRRIFWTEGLFDGPKVQVTNPNITSINPAYYYRVPKAVAEEVVIPGYTPATPNLTTLSFDRYNGIGQLHAHNVEGRVLVEYLGQLRQAPNVFQSLGTELVELIRTPPINYPSVNLGSEIKPSNGDITLSASPVLSTAQTGASYYGTHVLADGTQVYHAERETSPAKAPDTGEPALGDAYNKVVFYWLEESDFGIKWPLFQDRYWLRWSPNLNDYAHHTVADAGSEAGTGISFAGGALPELVHQDDPAQMEARLELATQRLMVEFTAGSQDLRNRALLKFSSSSKIWYVNVYTQAEGLRVQLTSTSSTSGGVTTVTVPSTAGLEVGMVISGGGVSGAVITKILNGTQFEVSLNLQDGTQLLTYTVESDQAAPIDTTATVGTRLAPPAGHEKAGFISSGTNFYPDGYRNPFVVGVPAANLGAIIPVNALPNDCVLKVRWFKKVPAPSAEFQDLYVPGKWGRYTVSYPASTNPQIILAQGLGTDDLIGAKAAGAVYYQNDPAKAGYNPNEEHALMVGGRAYALRDDLNIHPGVAGYQATDYTSEPFLLLAYKDPEDGRPAMQAYKVVREIDQNNDGIKDPGDILFDYPATAGTLLVKPYPLPLMPLPLQEGVSKDMELLPDDQPGNDTVSNNEAYRRFTFQDRKGFTWVHRGPHDGGSRTLIMKLYYTSRAGFFIPGMEEPSPGTILPFLRDSTRKGQRLNLDEIEEGEDDEPLPIVYRPQWPANAPELRVGETLTLAKFGLPQVRGQTSAQILYEQSIANALSSTGLTKSSVTLHDPTREKVGALDEPGIELDQLPAAIKTTSHQGRTHFQLLPPHLQQRFYFDPLRGRPGSQKLGSLVFKGAFHDMPSGEDYLDLNLLSATEKTALKDLVPETSADKSKWDGAVDALVTRVETFMPDPAQAGSFLVDAGRNQDVGENEMAIITDPDTAVDSYALTATGQGVGFVTMVFGNGRAFTPQGDPVQVQVFRVASQLYVGDLKVVSSSNPLDEQVTLRHSADFAGKPEDYDFEWRWSTGAASAPATYSMVMTKRLGDPVNLTQNWIMVSDPGSRLPTNEQYDAAAPGLPFTPARTVNVRPAGYTEADIAQGYPSLVLKASSGLDFSDGIPGEIVFSANLGSHDGFVLYVNEREALAHKAPAHLFTLSSAASSLTENGLNKQFHVEPGYFTRGVNKIEVAIYTSADPNAQSSLSFLMEAAQETDLVDAAVTPGTQWQIPGDPNGRNTNIAIVGGHPLNPFGGPQFVLNDRWFTMRYRPKAGSGNVLGTTWSRWMPPQFVEGWVKRVLAAINPFEQRVKDLYNNQVNTDVSVLTQAGTRWEGDVALTLDNINDVGLIAIYETVLNRAKNMSIDANTNDPDSNNALLLVAGYLNDLYTFLGNEAYADAANPTISLDDQSGITEVNTSRFSFEGQVASSLDEELALLKGRDDFTTRVDVAPAYNRLYWNYTRGINGGEAIYAINYNIKEKVGSGTADGVIDEADAQRMFPQGHGDAYGHYLTALKGYTRLISHPNFTWTPRAEAVTVLGQPVTVDFQDERKFAAAAGNLARTAQQVVALVYRQVYKDDAAAGWTHFRDSRGGNPSTGVTSHQGLDEWVSRSAQGAFYNWVVANAMVPDVDNYHSGVQKIDRTTVPEIPELAAAVGDFQNSIDAANSYLNPLGLSPGAIAFDLSPSELQAGNSHYEQVSGRALTALRNAAGAFNQAASMTRSLRDQGNQIDDYATVLSQQERAYVNQLVDIFGRPYAGEVGAGKLYAQGYHGPDLFHWFIVDRPNDLVDLTQAVSTTITMPVEVDLFAEDPMEAILGAVDEPVSQNKTVKIYPHQLVQYNDVWEAASLGSRPETGELQSSLQDVQQSMLAVREAATRYELVRMRLMNAAAVLHDLIKSHNLQQEALTGHNAETLNLESRIADLQTQAALLNKAADIAVTLGGALAESPPKVVGLASDATSSIRSAFKIVAYLASYTARAAAIYKSREASENSRNLREAGFRFEEKMQELGFRHEEVQMAFELDNLYREHTSHENELMQLTLAHQRALQHVSNVLARGERILHEREVFRQRAAAIIQGYRTKDLGFRIFRNEALEQYRSLFDLASRYTYLAAKSYDYETGLLGTPQGQTVFSKIVSARALGDLTGGEPQASTSTLGDAGLAGTMARLNADFSVAKGRLGINNPDQYGTVFSLRAEQFRIRTDAAIVADDNAWRQTLEQHMVANLLADADVATHCRNLRKPDGTPVPGILIPFSTTIEHAKNFFGNNYLPGDHNYTPSNFATKIHNAGIAFPGYVGMDTYAAGSMSAGAPASGASNALGATPYVYLIPCGNDYMIAPPLGDTNTLRSWKVHDQALPLPFNLGANDFNSMQFFNSNGTLSEQPWIIRKHQAFRAVSDASFFYGSLPTEFTNSRLVGRSVWNGLWKLVIPAYTLHSNEQEGLNRFAASVRDIQLFLRTYSHSGN